MKKNVLFSLLALATLWLGWIIAYYAIGNEYILPSFWETIKQTGRLLAEGSFWRAFFGTLRRTVLSFLVSFVLGVAAALCANLCAPVRAFFAPIVSVLRTVPTMAVILALLLWTTPSAAPVIVSFLVLFPASYAAALTAFDETSSPFGDLARAYRVPLFKRIFGMILPLGAPSLIKQSGAILSMGLKITVSAEVLANTYKSLGGMMQEAKMYLEMPQLLALTLLTVLLGFVLEGIFVLAEKLIVRWRA